MVWRSRERIFTSCSLCSRRLADHAPTSVAGKVIGPSFSADEVTDVIEAVIETYRAQRSANEKFIDTVKRVGIEPFKTAANAVRRTTAKAA